MIVGGAISLTVAATYLVRRLVPEELHASNNQVAGFLFAAVAVIYGVLLALTTLMVWQQFQDAQVTVEREANVIVDLVRQAQELPTPYGNDLKQATISYAQIVDTDEWNTMTRGESSPKAEAALEAIWTVDRRIHQDKINAEEKDQFIFEIMDTLGNLRRIRLLESKSELPSLMWLLLCGGALLMIGFTLFFRVKNARAHLLMVALLSALIAFILLMILELDNPFTGMLHVPPLAFQQALEIIQRMR